jgi:hypothetical protein
MENKNGMNLQGLEDSARDHLALLRAVHLCGRDLYLAGPDLSQAIAVYVTQWLPKLNNHNESSSLEPPEVDVAWVWHLHKTAPFSYQRDCIQWYGRILDVPAGMNPFSHSHLLSLPEVPVDMFSGIDSEFAKRIASSAENHSSFFWHANWPEYFDPAFLTGSVNRYEMMLRLMKMYPNQLIVPTFDIDNIWRTHLAFPSRYIEDCRRLAGREINRSDELGNNRSVAGFCVTSTSKTEQLWNASYDSTWRRVGGMHRGEPPCWFWSDRQQAAAPFFSPSPALAAAKSLPRIEQYAVHIVGRAFGTAGGKEVCSSNKVPCIGDHIRIASLARIITQCDDADSVL